jgi:hypothetical protein
VPDQRQDKPAELKGTAMNLTVQQLVADPLVHAADAFGDFVNVNASALPAFDEKSLATVPPDEHVLDHLARARDLVGWEIEMSSVGAHTVYVLHGALPKCDLCWIPARYDTRFTSASGRTVMGYACEQCLRVRGDHRLGAGHSTYLMAQDEVSPQVRAVVDELCRRLGREPIWE